MLDIAWADLLLLNACRHRATFLKMMTLLWNVEVKALAEIGVYRGAATRLLRGLFPDAVLHLIDPWKIYPGYLSDKAGPITKDSEDLEQAYLEVVQQFGKDPKVKILRETSQDASRNFSQELDLVFIDGNHDYAHVKQDIQIWSTKVRPGGIISGHDYNPDKFPQVVRAVHELLGEDVLVGDDYTWAKQKK